MEKTDKITQLVLLLLISSLGYSQKTDTLFYKATLRPIEATEPTSIITINSPDPLVDSLNFYVFLNSTQIRVKLRNEYTIISNKKHLSQFIKDNNINSLNIKSYIDTTTETPIQNTREIMKVFSDNGITQFSVINH